MNSDEQQSLMRPYVLAEGEGIDGDSALKAARRSTGGSFTLIESHTDGGAPPHVHSRDDEYLYVLDGFITVQIGDETFEAGPRAFVFMPRGMPHAWDVIREKSPTATVLMMTVPGGLEEFLAEYHVASGASKAVKDEIAARYGITWLASTRTNP